MDGRGFDLFDQRGGLSGFNPVESFSGDGLRRMIYAHKVRREREAVFGAFDCPDAGRAPRAAANRTTPIQALNLFNSRFTIEQAEAFAARVKADVGDDVAKQIRRAYQLALSRDPAADELARRRARRASQHGLASALPRALQQQRVPLPAMNPHAEHLSLAGRHLLDRRQLPVEHAPRRSAPSR